MKKTDVLLICSTLVFSLLFYQQSPGINCLIFNIILILAAWALNPSIFNRWNIVLVALGAIISAFNIVWNNTVLSIVINILSLVVFAGLTLNPQSSFIVATINSVYSFAASVLIKTVEKIDRSIYGSSSKPREGSLSWLKVFSFLIPGVVALIFFFLYTSANPVINELLAVINFDFISWDWVRFTALGFLILFGFFHQSHIESLTLADSKAPNVLQRKKSLKKTLNALALKYELKSGWLLLLTLNLLLFGFHMVDGYFIIMKKFEGTLRYSTYLHQGVNTLITSIVLAILVILYYFRANINFHKQNGRIKNLAYLWVLQNVLLVGTTIYKNLQYVSEYGLTYKRIGVYIYLLLTFIGLVTTLVKINKLKSSWYLVRVNSWMFYGVFILATFLNWDKLITRYNLSKTDKVDTVYLINLTSKNLPELLAMKNEGRVFLSDDEKGLIEKKKLRFLKKMKNKKWPSWNYQDQFNYNKIK